MKEAATEWLRQAKYDLSTAKAMFEAERHIYAVFMCHLAVEKAIKALITERTGEVPPKSHNLIRLAKLADVEMEDVRREFISTLSVASVETRYPALLDVALEKYSEAVAREFLEKAEDFVKWAEEKLVSKE